MSDVLTKYGEAAFKRVADSFESEIVVIFSKEGPVDIVRYPPSSDSISKEDISKSANELVKEHEQSEDYVRIPLEDVKIALVSRDI